MISFLKNTTIFSFLAYALWIFPAAAQDGSPLIMDGKEQLFQRVLMRDRIPRYDAPDGSKGSEIAPLSPLYVYERNGGWLKVARGDKGSDTFWVPSKAAVDWNQNIVVTFEGSENVGRVLFFKNQDKLYDIIEAEDPSLAIKEFRQQAIDAEQNGESSQDIVAMGPRKIIDQRQNLYVMPILESEEAIFENGAFVNLLKVAVAKANPDAPEINIDIPRNSPDSIRERFKAGVVFVVDTTISMEPYIKGTKAALQEIFKSVNAQTKSDAISFALVGYRDNIKASPGLGYDVKTFVDLQEGFTANNFLNGINQMTEANSSSKNFREDSYAGIEHALSALRWSEFAARYVILVTDAGPRESSDDLSSTGLSATGLNNVAKERLGAIISVMHLRTARGARDHESAEQAYRQLTKQPNQQALYFPVPGGNPKIYRKEAQKLGQMLADQVVAFREGAEPEDFAKDDGTGFASALRSAGRTMQLAYLGKAQGTKAPDVFEGYIADRDFDRTGLKPLSIRLLLNKSELSNLNEAISIIIEKAEENVINPNQFFAQILGAAADMSRRPDEVSRRADTSLADAVYVAEYLEGLPYKSRIMKITEDEWIRLSISEQQTVVNELYDKIERYRKYNEATDQWVDYLGTGNSTNSLLYPMKLDDLP